MQAPGQQMAPGQKQTAPGQRTAPGQQRGGEAQERQGGQAQRGQGGAPEQAPEQKEAVQPRDKQPQRTEQPDRRRQKAEEPTRSQRQRAEEPERKDRERAEQPERKDRERAERPDQRPRVTEQQRTTVVQRFRETGAIDRARVTDVDIDISVGTRVPRERIRLAPVPAVIVEEVPAYRGHLFFVVRDEIVIVEPSTYVIVDVIRLDGAPGRAARVDGRLTLTSEQREIVLAHIDLQPGVRLGIGEISVGMSVPGTVELRPFPRAVIAEVPELEGYRYFVFDQEVAIVDPDERRIVLTISE